MSKNAANRHAADHLKEGVKNIKTVYKALYNQSGPMGGAKTAPQNVRAIVTGRATSGGQKIPASTRASAAAMGAASVTPLGPVAMFAQGVNKSMKAKAAALGSKAPPPAPVAMPKIKTKAPAAAPTPAPGRVGVKPPNAPPAIGPKVGAARVKP